MNFRKNITIAWAISAVFIFALSVSAQDKNAKKALRIEYYERWRTIISPSISNDGSWLAFGYHTLNKDDTLYVKNRATGKEFEIPRGSNAKFSDDSRWAAYTISLPLKEIKKRQKEKKPVPVRAELLNLSTGEKFSVNNAGSFMFSKGSKYFAVKKKKTDPAVKYKGTDLLLRNLETGMNGLRGSVAEFSFSKTGTLLAYTVDAEDSTGNGLYLADFDTGVERPLDTGKAIYERLTWDEEGTVLAILKGTKKKDCTQKDNILLIFTGLKKGDFAPVVFNPAEASGFPEDMVISEKGALSWSSGVDKIFFGIKKQEKEPEKKKEDAEPAPNVDIFHWKDDRIQTVQERQAARDRSFTFRSVFNLKTKRFVRLADEAMRTIRITRDGKWGIGEDDRAYISDWKPRKADFYRVNTGTGEKTLMFKAQGSTMGLSPDSRHFLYWKDGGVWDYVISSGKSVNLTQDAPVSFVNVDYDHPGEKPPYGVAGWTKDGKSVILRHKYDLWLQPLNGGRAANLTNGRGASEEIRFRYVQLDPEEKYIDLFQPVLLSAYGEWTKKEGFFELKKGKLEKLLYVDKHFGRIAKAKNADAFMYTIETFADYPDYYVSGKEFSSPQRVTDANPWKSEYKWGRRILFDFRNREGVRLQGTLAIPDDYQEGQRLPMIVNFYEKKSQDLHHFYAPIYGSRYPSGNIGPVAEFAAYVSNGYLVMQPDIHFNTGTTHDDMLDCVEAATKKVIEMGYADPARIGLCGGSFSGGGSAYIATRSKMFAAVASRAAPINLAGEFNILFHGSGQNNHRYDIYGQGRYGTNPFDNFELYRSQSPITYVATMDTPLLYLHGGKDGSVEYNQGMEFYNALRFLGKPVIFLSYPDEGHNLKKLENQKDFTVRLRQFFDHYLKGKPAPEWMIKGVPYLKKKK